MVRRRGLAVNEWPPGLVGWNENRMSLTLGIVELTSHPQLEELSMQRSNHRTSTLRTLTQLVLAAAVMVAGVGFSQTASAQDLKVGYVDLQRALTQVEEGKEAKAKLKKDFEDKQAKLDKKQKEVKKLKEELKSQSMALSAEAKKKKRAELQKKMAELQRMYMSLQRNLSQKEAKATKGIFKKMRKVVRKIAEEKGYDLVLEKRGSSVLFAKDAMDLTDELIKRYDSE
jgi:outer membrane protein